MSNNRAKMQPWQVFQAARKYLGADTVARIFNREIRSAHSWAQDPAFTAHRCRSPLELLHALFERLDAVGLGYVARAAIGYLETAVYQEQAGGAIREPLPTIQEEILADYSAVAELQRTIESRGSLADVMRLKQEAMDEIERTVARYVKDTGGADEAAATPRA
ncbi:hypothetical protein [Desulfofustis limnaeus]|uniref:Uncharacterized protein n=1 Tax=Desulfofustis limnaeus TaxID=2740163 RepID=A0ABN6MAA1_9BACT|nr:hypothetical protein [Desulfofustis limnaeus]BDD88731.1 hypothetical protein DPPLL_30960 [Desulfofustis limnaeus]